MSERPSRLRRTFVVDRSYQYHSARTIIAVALVIYLSLGALSVREVQNQDAMLVNLQQRAALLAGSGARPEDVKLIEASQAHLEGDTFRFVLLLAGVLVPLVGCLVWLGIRGSHRAAGPVVAMSRYLAGAVEGTWGPMRPLRKQDEFLYLHARLNALQGHVAARDSQEAEALRVLAGRLRRGGDVLEIVGDLEALARKKDGRFEA